ncbi:protein fuzzy homolog [Ischnura elegans]|uniref:protein fuzzy homolog n=1 Tax=Ischnura elegans TaxID=197161 RepID=UPI001ED8B4E6|nr:protein fuzzy homolog [Ischnura elegans]
MASRVICVTMSGGLPVFTRERGPCENLSFAVMASLNGVHMYTKSQSASLLNTETKESTIVWRDFESSLTLIGIANGLPEPFLDSLLENVFNAMILMVGVEELREIRSLDRLKRNLRVCYPLIDKLLESAKPEDKAASASGLIWFSEVALCHESHVLQGMLDTYAEAIDSMYGCLQIQGRVVVATSGWWSLTGVERSLLSLLVSVENLTTLRDIPIFLPHKSPKVPFRLVTCHLLPWAEVLVLCGPEPSLDIIEKVACQMWQVGSETLRAANIHCPSPRNIPSSINLDPGVLGFLLLDDELQKFLLSVNVLGDACLHEGLPSHGISEAHRKTLLWTFYRQIASTFLMKNTASGEEPTNKSVRECPSQAKESYWSSEFHKCHALVQGSSQIFVLYSAAVPTHTMRILTKSTLQLFISDKQLCW